MLEGIDLAAMLVGPLALASSALTGLLAGAMILLRAVLVPFWRDLPPAEFRAWFARYSDRIRALMVPLGVGAAAASVAATVARAANEEDVRASSVAAAGAVGVVGVTVTVNEPANHRFTSGELGDEETTTLLARWARWHDVRVALGVIAAVAAARALNRR